MHMGEIWSAEPNRAIAFVNSPKKVQKRIIQKEKEALGAVELENDSDVLGSD